MAIVPNPAAIHDPSTGGIAPASWGDELNAAVAFLVNPPSCRLKKTAVQSYATGAFTSVDWEAEDWDTDAIHDNAVNKSRMTCKTAGKYYVWASLDWAANVTGIRAVYFKVSGGAFVHTGLSVPASTGATDTDMFCAMEVQLAVNDYVEVAGNQNSGAALNLLTTRTFAGMRWVGQ